MHQRSNSDSGVTPPNLSTTRQPSQTVSSAEFKRRFTRLILLTWIVPPVFGLSFLVLIELFTPAQIRDIVLSPTEATFVLGSLFFAVWYFRRYCEGICKYLQSPSEDQIPEVIRIIQRFPVTFWIIFLVYLALAPTSVMLSAEWFAEYESQPLDWFRIHLVALIVSILVGLPVFYLIFDLFGKVLGGISLNKAVLTIRTKVFLIGSLIPLLVDTLLIQYYWTRTGFFNLETFGVWLALELAAIYGTLIFVRSFGQSLQPFEKYVLDEHRDRRLEPNFLVPQSTDELGVLAGRFKKVLEQQRILEEQLLHAQKMEAVGRLAGGVAHDFNNELSVILGHTELLKVRMAGDDVQSKYVDNIIDAIGRATNLIQSLLTFSRRRAVQLRAVRLNEIVTDIKEILQRLVGNDIEVRFEPCHESAVVKVDRGQIEQVLINLCLNARDAMPEGGSLTIRAERVIAGDSEEGIGPHAILEVTDSGVGMDEVTQRMIFEPFFTTKEADKGTGLGLAMVHGIVGKHDGSIDVSSAPDEGTTFTIRLPLTDEKVDNQQVPVVSARGGAETVLLAEDDDNVRDLFQGYLERYGYEVIVAANGEDAIRRFREHGATVNLVILNIGIPKKNGWQVLADIRKSDSEAKVILMSGNSQGGLERRRIDEADVPVLNKPFSPQDLLDEVRRTLDV